MKKIRGGITAPRGFFQAGIHCGIKKRNLDLALVLSEVPATACGLFTSNSFKAAPVVLSRKYLDKKSHRAVIINSGNANCLTGKAGIADSITISDKLGSLIGCGKEEVLVCSTGIIGKRLPMSKIKKSLPLLVSSLHRAPSKKAANAIMTTDTFLKEAAYSVKIGRKSISLAGIAKGAGMIEPNMATMLAVITTDARVEKRLLKRALKEAVEKSFNSITIDGDMSTNDTIILLANGLSGVDISESSGAYMKFAAMLKVLCLDLAKMIVKDGEGATKFIKIEVIGAKNFSKAREVGLKIANSPLFKTMCYGNNPNFGRIAAACGAVSRPINSAKVDIYLNGRKALDKGVAVSGRLPRSIFRGKNIKIRVCLNSGMAKTSVFTSDLSPEYVKINAAYS
jgi:glutamate N-acetyltransferase/amino-acid N-acetyltransferase